MAKKTNNKGKTTAKIRVVSQGYYAYDIKRIFSFLDGFSKSSKKYNSLDIKVDSNLVKQKTSLSNS